MTTILFFLVDYLATCKKNTITVLLASTISDMELLPVHPINVKNAHFHQ